MADDNIEMGTDSENSGEPVVPETDGFITTTDLGDLLSIPWPDLFSFLEGIQWIKREKDYWELTEKGLRKGGELRSINENVPVLFWPPEIERSPVFKTYDSKNRAALSKKGADSAASPAVKSGYITAFEVAGTLERDENDILSPLEELGWFETDESGNITVTENGFLKGYWLKRNITGEKTPVWPQSVLLEPDIKKLKKRNYFSLLLKIAAAAVPVFLIGYFIISFISYSIDNKDSGFSGYIKYEKKYLKNLSFFGLGKESDKKGRVTKKKKSGLTADEQELFDLLTYDKKKPKRFKDRYPNNSNKWVKNEDTYLLNSRRACKGFKEISAKLKRRPLSISMRAKTLIARVRTPVKVVNVIDGDTIIVDFGEKEEIIRYLGIDTPEITKGKNERYGVEAYNENRKFVENRTVYLDYDGSRGHYDRLLAYIYTDTGYLVNYHLAKNGYARLLTFNHKMRSTFESAVKSAQKRRLGLWR